MAVFIPDDKISEIRNAADIVDVISEAVVLKKTGRNYLGLCPFHSEKTPSFSVSPEKQIFYCFGCGVGGNIFSFMMKQHGLSFPEAAKVLSGRYGIEIPTRAMSPDQKRRMNERERLLAVNKLAMEYYQTVLLNSSAGKKARAYLAERGMTGEIIERFHLGYAPKGWDSLVNLFAKKRIPHVLAEKAGLIVSRKSKSGFYDRFRDRIIFPIFDAAALVIGFGGRVLDDSLPKYLNSPETPIYAKSRTLYGIHLARSKSREHDRVYIAEGYFDLLALHQHGIENSVATLGTSLTTEHVRILKGLVGKEGGVILVYDSDSAGIKAAQRSIEVFDKGYLNAQILILPAGHDPDSYIFESGVESFLGAAAGAKGIMSFLIDSTVSRHNLTTDGKIRIIRALQKPLASIPDKVDRSFYIKELAERIGVDETAISEKIGETFGRDLTPKKSRQPDSAPLLPVEKKNNRLELQIVAMMLQFPDMLTEIRKRNIVEYFDDDTLKSIARVIFEHGGGIDVQIPEIISLFDDNEKKSIVASLAMRDDLWNSEGCLKLITQFESSRSRRRETLLQRIQAAENEKNYELVDSLLREKQISVKKRK